MTTTKIISALSLVALLTTGVRMYCNIKQYKKDQLRAKSVLDEYSDDLAQEVLSNGTFEEAERLESITTDKMVVVMAQSEERRHRRLPHGHTRNKYLNAIVCEIKAKVGTLIDREANRMIVRRLARGLMETHGLRPTHQAQVLPMLVEMCLIPSSLEIEAKNFGERPWAVNTKGYRQTGWYEWMFGGSRSSSL